VISTHNVSHVPLGLDALGAGLATVIDKPLAATAADGRRLAAAAAASGLLLSVFQNRRWDADVRTVRRLIDDGRLGAVHRFESRYERWVPAADTSAWRERGAPEEAGGLLFDLGSHLVDQAMQLFGKPTRVYAEVDLRREGVEVDDDVFVALEHPGGVRSHLWTTVLAASAGPRFRVLGDRGTFEKHGMDVQEPALAAGGMPGDRAWGREPEAQWGRLTTPDGSEVVESLPGAYETYYAGIAHALRTGGPPPVDVEDSIAGLEVLEAARESARTHTVVALA
jgi:predicted dehydrogenase